MLKHFTWQQFLIAALVLSIIWYLALILVFYRKKIQDYLKGGYPKSTPPEPLIHDWDEEFEDDPLSNEDDLIGKPVLPEGMTRVSMAQFGFAPRVSPVTGEEDREADFKRENTNDERERQQSLVPDVLEELKSIFHVLETGEGTKQDFISLFGLVSAKYPHIKGTASQHALNAYIRDNVLFPISDEELGNLWN
ncbi:hypothetical protein [Mucilaginibacter sp. NFX135]|uniref:hypothetical protein n=1 Tax=Mucilaginibacter sp. NFX135 TaxID=3402687 RepID=UPI003AFA2D75